MSDATGDRCKRFEMAEAGRCAMPGLPLLARLDGRAFHTFTRGFDRPYDLRMTRCMQATMCALVDEFHAAIGYTQSDEITLLFGAADDMLFGGRFQKLTSVLAGFCSAAFALRWAEQATRQAVPHFDCRVWQVPTQRDAASVFIWREDDAVKNSVQMAAQSKFSRAELHKKHTGELQEMLFQRGINWNEYPSSFKRGTYARRVVVQRALTDDERMRIPEAHRPAPGELFTRSSVDVVAMPPVRRVENLCGVLFDGETPKERTS